MEKHLGDIITKDEARAIVLFAIGREATEDELSGTLVHYFEPSPLLQDYSFS